MDRSNRQKLVIEITALSPMDRSTRQKLDREIQEITDVMNQIDVTNIYRTFHTSTKEYTFFSAPHGTFSKIDHIRGNKANLQRYKKFGVSSCVLSDHHRLKLESTTILLSENLQAHGNLTMNY